MRARPCSPFARTDPAASCASPSACPADRPRPRPSVHRGTRLVVRPHGDLAPRCRENSGTVQPRFAGRRPRSRDMARRDCGFISAIRGPPLMFFLMKRAREATSPRLSRGRFPAPSMLVSVPGLTGTRPVPAWWMAVGRAKRGAMDLTSPGAGAPALLERLHRRRSNSAARSHGEDRGPRERLEIDAPLPESADERERGAAPLSGRGLETRRDAVLRGRPSVPGPLFGTRLARGPGGYTPAEARRCDDRPQDRRSPGRPRARHPRTSVDLPHPRHRWSVASLRLKMASPLGCGSKEMDGSPLGGCDPDSKYYAGGATHEGRAVPWA